MSPYSPEALFIGVKEGLKFCLTLSLVLAIFRSAGLKDLGKALFAGIAVVFAGSFAVMTLPAGPELRDLIVRMIGYSFGLFYLFSLAALFHVSGTDLLGPFASLVQKKAVLYPAVFLLTLLYYVPDMAGSSLYLSDLSFMAGSPVSVFGPAAAGLAVAAASFFFAAREVGRKISIKSLLGLPQVLLLLALIKLTAGGVRGFAELSLIPSVQTGIIKLIHDVVHQVLVTIMIPDHPILTTTAWNFIGFLFGNALTLWLSLIVFVLPLLLFVKKHFSEEPPLPQGLQTRASRRLYIKSFRDTRFLKSVPSLVFLLVIATVWFAEKGESGNGALYIPDPRPAAATGGVVTIPLHAPSDDLLDGKLHKFSVTVGGEVYRLLAMKKPDGTLALCLDACEICQPDGYGQGREHVVCLYCRTPIPFDTVGKPGGCNPVPLSALVTEKEVRVDLSELLEKWKTVHSAKNGEGLR